MKTVDLKTTTNILINLDEQPYRLESATECLNKLGIPFYRYSAIKHSLGIVGCGMSHHAVITEASPNTLILEDDIGLTDNAQTLFTVPDETDALYLGVADHGYIRKDPVGRRGVVLTTQYNKEYKQVFNMCGAHAVVYLTERYILAAKNIAKECLDKGIAWDLGIASIHRHFNILTPNAPVFYQTEQEEFTNLILD